MSEHFSPYFMFYKPVNTSWKLKRCLVTSVILGRQRGVIIEYIVMYIVHMYEGIRVAFAANNNAVLKRATLS